MQESINLFFQEGSSDKVYNAELTEQSEGWVVNFAYGRRGNSLNTGTKTKEPVAYDVAKKAYDKLVKSKMAKGYKPNGTDGSPIAVVADREDSGIRPQLLNEMTEEVAQVYINDDNFCMQEKFDGRRKMIARDIKGNLKGINKKGVVVPLTQEIEDATINFYGGPFVVDGEDMGSFITLFDDLTDTDKTYKERYEELVWRTSYVNNTHIKVVETAWTTEDKQKMFNDLKDERAEGVVFKRIDALYSAGRPASGGAQFKCKFYESASCIVSGHHPTKNSISLDVYDDNDLIDVGNVTVYPNQVTPAIGDIVEVKYLYYNEGGSLYQPVLLGIRDDVDMRECLIDKLKRKKD
jgi:bifunctional non-homologous end joining protein LigD